MRSRCSARLGSVSSSANADWPRQLAGASNDTQRRRAVLPSPRPTAALHPPPRQASTLPPATLGCPLSPAPMRSDVFPFGAPLAITNRTCFEAPRPQTTSPLVIPSTPLAPSLTFCLIFLFRPCTPRDCHFLLSSLLPPTLLAHLFSSLAPFPSPWQAAARPIYALFLDSFPSGHNFDCAAYW